MSKVVVIDNYDSFTFNLVHYLQQLEVDVIVRRNDEVTLSQIEQLAPSHIVISPGPCDPDRAGISLALVKHFKDKMPILGVCLGHQVIAQAFGATITKAHSVIHGKTSPIYHSNAGIFKNLCQGFKATRYHSLIIEKNSLPDCLEITAWNQDSRGDMEYIMGIKHKSYPIEGLQFHPESILSEYGLEFLTRFIAS